MIETGKGYLGNLCKQLGLPVWVVLAAAGFVFYRYFWGKK